MKTFSKLFILAAVLIIASCASVDKPSLKAVADADLSASEIYGLYPLNVLPGTMVSVRGEGFGDIPGPISVGGVVVEKFFGWDDTTIWFAVPEEMPDEAEVIVGNSVSEQFLYYAPEDSLTLRVVVDADAVQLIADTMYEDYGLTEAPFWTYPLFMKGQWIKSGEAFGMKSGSWDTGSKTIMWNRPGTNIWILETVFTPENVDSFKPGIMLFAFEDGNDEERNLSPYESDTSFILKKEWAMADEWTDVSSDPGVRIRDNDMHFDEKTRTITITFPVMAQ
jgi:hypothetical protein